MFPKFRLFDCTLASVSLSLAQSLTRYKLMNDRKCFQNPVSRIAGSRSRIWASTRSIGAILTDDTANDNTNAANAQSLLTTWKISWNIWRRIRRRGDRHPGYPWQCSVRTVQGCSRASPRWAITSRHTWSPVTDVPDVEEASSRPRDSNIIWRSTTVSRQPAGFFETFWTYCAI